MKAYTVIRGGLGNQLFQFARLRSFSLTNYSQEFYDLRNGFRFEEKYGNCNQLHRFNMRLSKVPKSFGDILWLNEKLGSKFSWKIAAKSFGALGIELIQEKSNCYQADELVTSNQSYFLSGYWQSWKYFKSSWNVIKNDFVINEFKNLQVLNFAKTINESNSLAIGLRNYEETNNKTLYARYGKVKHHLEWKKQIDKLYDEMSSPRIYIFGTQITSEQITKMGIKGKKYMIIPLSEYRDSVDSMFLFSAARNHMFNNSTFYWWGAFLREVYFESTDQKVYASNNFLNLDCLPHHWQTW
jgi:hypothetical protein